MVALINSFLNSSKVDLNAVNNTIVSDQIKQADLVLTKLNNIVLRLINSLNNFAGDNAKELYVILDNISFSLRSLEEINVKKIDIYTRRTPYIYSFPCQDGIIARVFEIVNNVSGLFYILETMGPICPQLQDHLISIFNKLNLSLEQLQKMIQDVTIKKYQDDNINRSVMFSSQYEEDEDNEEYEN